MEGIVFFVVFLTVAYFFNKHQAKKAETKKLAEQEARKAEQAERHRLKSIEEKFLYIENRTTLPRFHDIVRNYEAKYLALKGENRKEISNDFVQSSLKVGEREEVKL